MADFRRWIPVLAVIAILCGVATTANAQGSNGALQCIAAGGVTPLLRSQGITELAGDLVINCTGGTSTLQNAPVPTVNVQIFLNTSVTSRLIGGGTEALLMIDEPAPLSQKYCTVNNALCAAPGSKLGVGASVAAQQAAYNGSINSNVGATAAIGTAYNVWQGALAASNSVSFNGVPIDPPGTSGLTRVIRITNVRANASGLGVAGPNAPPTSLIAVISASPSTSLPITNNAQQVVGFVQNGLVVTQTPPSPSAYQQCFGADEVDGGTITFTEGFATSFKTRTINIGNGSIGNPYSASGPLDQNTPGLIYNTESGFYQSSGANPLGIPAGVGLADFGTRLRVIMTSLQPGITVCADSTIGNSTLNAVLTSSEAGPFSASSATCFTATATATTAEWVWEVVAADSTQTETAVVNITASWSGPPNAPALGTNQFSGWFAPTSTVTVAADSTVPIPRFVDNSVLADDFAIVKCATHLLYPFVTNQAGFDTGLAIANTSTDQYGTTPQTGTCTLYFYGDQAPAAFTTPADVASGTVWAATALTLAPGFQGYVIADCEFQYAHGFAFVTKVGTTDVAMGYLALVIPDSPYNGNRAPSPFNCRQGHGAECNNNSGEQLGY